VIYDTADKAILFGADCYSLGGAFRLYL